MSYGATSKRNASGVTLIEILVVIAIFGILAAVAANLYRSNDATTLSRHLARTLGEGRFAAIARNVNVVAAWDSDQRALILRSADLNTCNVDGPVVLRANANEFPRATVDASGFTTMAWQPNGIPVFCGSSSLPSMIVSDDARTWTLDVSALGEVSIE